MDSVLRIKLGVAKSDKIKIDADIRIPKVMQLEHGDIGVLYGNLLDNAIEACRMAKGDRFIRIYMAMKGNMLYFSMLNASGEKKKKKGSLFSSHKDGVHGFGLRRAEAILHEHGGWVKYNSEDGAFTSEFLVPAIE